MTSSTKARQGVTSRIRQLIIATMKAQQVPGVIYATVVSIQSATDTLTIEQSGSGVPTTGIRYMSSYQAQAGDSVVCAQVAGDLWVMGTMSGSVPGAPIAEANCAGGQTVTATPTAVPLGTIRIDNAGGMSASGYTVKRAGKYLVQAQVLVAQTSTTRWYESGIIINGTATYFNRVAGSSGDVSPNTVVPIQSSVGDVLKPCISASASGDTVASDGGRGFFSVSWQGL